MAVLAIANYISAYEVENERIDMLEALYPTVEEDPTLEERRLEGFGVSI